MRLRNTSTYYGSLAKLFHWTIALLIIGMLGVGFYMHGLDPTPFKFKIYTWHKSIGLLVLALVVLRLVWRLINPSPALLKAQMKTWEIKLAHLTHFLLYLCLFLMPLSGWLMASADSNPDPTIYGFAMPQLIDADKRLAGWFFQIHFITAWTLIGLIVLHVAGAFKHHFVNKDRT
ncbi:MAG: cytochrome b, partial [Pseudomonadota bacterium]